MTSLATNLFSLSINASLTSAIKAASHPGINATKSELVRGTLIRRGPAALANTIQVAQQSDSEDMRQAGVRLQELQDRLGRGGRSGNAVQQMEQFRETKHKLLDLYPDHPVIRSDEMVMPLYINWGLHLIQKKFEEPLSYAQITDFVLDYPVLQLMGALEATRNQSHYSSIVFTYEGFGIFSH